MLLAVVEVVRGLSGDTTAPFLVATVASLGALLLLGVAISRNAHSVKRDGG